MKQTIKKTLNKCSVSKSNPQIALLSLRSRSKTINILTCRLQLKFCLGQESKALSQSNSKITASNLTASSNGCPSDSTSINTIMKYKQKSSPTQNTYQSYCYRYNLWYLVSNYNSRQTLLRADKLHRPDDEWTVSS
ncbi:hypothetical protein PoB_002298500 [Plakobranchus ocellatus]|uniref:Uncharacterized protein n=1 Tax=Plakobranchus ocellatus TaxID=259542 RepID=A0AAV3ZMX9_9GAST|nr:hypothetical protein PoB_002298500 [Plakobranchus ocellatus]